MATITVGAGKQYGTIAAAVAASANGDTVLVDAGTYVNDFVDIRTSITLRSVGGLATVVSTVSAPNGKGIFVDDAASLTVDGFGFTGAQVGDGNGAGIRYDGGQLVIRNSVFWKNQDGLLANADPNGTILIDKSEFSQNGLGDGYTHNIYVNDVSSFTLENSYTHDAAVGHDIKSRAAVTNIINNRIQDNTTGSASYDIDLPNGGVATVQGNVIEKGPATSNPFSIHFGGEGTPYAGSSLTVSGNTLISDRAGAGLLLNQTPTAVSLTNNQIYGYTAAELAYGPVNASGNITLTTEPTLNTATLVPTTLNVPGGGTPVDLSLGTKLSNFGPAGAVVASGHRLTVGTGGQYATLSAALKASSDGDTIQVAAGTYVNDFSQVTTKVIIQGVGGMATFVQSNAPGNNTGIINITTDATLENLAFTGTQTWNGYAPGIEVLGGNVTLDNVSAYGNEIGIYAASNAATTLSVYNSDIGANGNVGRGSNSFQVGAIASLTIQGSTIHGATSGNELDDSAFNTDIENTTIVDGPAGLPNFLLNLGEGGNALIKNDTFVKGPTAQNGLLLHIGGNGPAYGNGPVQIIGDRFVSLYQNAGHPYTDFLVGDGSNPVYGTPVVTASGNTFVGGITGSPELLGVSDAGGNGAGVVVGAGEDFFGTTGLTEFVRGADGGLAAWGFNAAGTSEAGQSLTAQGAPLVIDAATSVVGGGESFFGTGGRAVFLRESGGGLQVDEFGAGGALTRSQALTVWSGGAFVVDTATTVVGGGEDFFGNAGDTVFARGYGGGLVVWEYSAAGVFNAGQALMTGQGGSVVIDGSTTVVGGGQDFFGTGGRAVFLRGSGGGIQVDEFNGGGVLTGSQALTVGGTTPFAIDTATTIVGGGQDFFGVGGRTLFARGAGGGLVAWEYGGTGVFDAGQALTDVHGAGVVIDMGTTVVGGGQDFFGSDGRAVFLRGSGGGLQVDEFDAGGAMTRSQALTVAGGGTFTIDTATTVVGGGEDFFGNGGHTAFARGYGGGLVAWEYNGAGVFNAGQALTTAQGGSVLIDTATTVVGGGQDFFGTGGRAVFLRGQDGGVQVDEFGAGGAMTKEQALNGTIDTATSVVGAGGDFFGNGHHAVFLRGAGGALSVWDVDAGGSIDIRQAFTIGGAAVVLDSASRVTGSAGDYLKTGGHAVFVLDGGGSQHVWEFNGSGVLTGVA